MSQETATTDYSTSDGVFPFFFCHYSSYDMPPHWWPTNAALAQQDVGSAAIAAATGNARGVVDLTTVLQAAASVLDAFFQVYANYVMCPLQLSFSFRV